MERTKLAWLRTLKGMSQSKLARESGVSIRVIQLAEQRQRSVDNMSAHSLYRLATALECPMEALLEHEFDEKIVPKH
jgi:transcriptional regulator with XRE-family HTH domain